MSEIFNLSRFCVYFKYLNGELLFGGGKNQMVAIAGLA